MFIEKGNVGLRNVVPRQGTETIYFTTINRIGLTLRNVVPRQGTETCNAFIVSLDSFIEKCSSPTGDGNTSFGIVVSTFY